MKKILAIIVAFMYLFITSGLVLQIHYCMDKQVGSSIKFSEAETHTCVVCGMKNAKNKCCHDEIKFIKLQDAHKTVNADYSVAPPPTVSQEFNLVNVSLFSADSEAACTIPSPDDDDGQPPLFLLNQFFRI
jgi:hypothetical protein